MRHWSEMTRKELVIQDLRCDIQHIGMESDYNRLGLRSILESRYVDRGRDITQEEFDRVLVEEYKKVEAWRARHWGKG